MPGVERPWSGPAETSLRKLFIDTAETVITAVVIFVLLQVTTQSFQIEGSSMDPTLLNGERLLVNRFVYARSGLNLMGQENYLFHGPQRGDVVVFKPPIGNETDFVKRVIGIPGDIIDIDGADVYVNGEKTEYVDEPTSRRREDYPLVVPEDMYFVLGDNRSASNDSRNWGFVSADSIEGRAWIAYWPLSELKFFN